MAKLKELHRGNCLEDLQKYYDIPCDLHKRKFNLLCTSAKSLIVEAERFGRDGDQEESFIYYMKFFNLLNVIKKTPELRKNREIVSILGGNSYIKEILHIVEKLSDSLKIRYDSKKKKIDSVVKNEVMDIPVDEEMPTRTNKTITCPELYELMQNNDTNFLLIDCRSELNYIRSHIRFNESINIPQHIIRNGLSAAAIHSTLPPQLHKLWSSRINKEYLILMDSNTYGPDPLPNTALSILYNILKNYDQDIGDKPILILEKGYDEFFLLYPYKCFGLSAEDSTTTLVPDDLEEIEYPTITDISMKYEAIKEIVPTGRPGVNRLSKVDALRKYDDKQRNIADIISERESLIKLSLQTEIDRLQSEMKWDSILKEELRVEQEEKEQLLLRETEIQYKCLQLESQQQDYLQEIEILKKELEELKVKSTQTSVNKQSLEINQDTLKRIHEKEEEFRKVSEERSSLAVEREKKLQLARKLKVDKNQDQNISRPQIVDRSNKPTSTLSSVLVSERENSTAKINKGLTGINNLGNTCYLNSILQCISNTKDLTNFFCNRIANDNINRTSNSRGKIADEIRLIFEMLWSGNYLTISPIKFKNVIGQLHTQFKYYDQQDAHEFLTILVDELHSDLQTIKVKPIESLFGAADKAWFQYTRSIESEILRLFYGQIKSTIKCRTCNMESATYETFSNLSLELRRYKNQHLCFLQNSLNLYFYGDPIDDWFCSTCQIKTQAIKKMALSKLPEILVIHLKRFDGNSSVGFQKNTSSVVFPLEDLDVEEYVAPNEVRRGAITKTKYNMYAVSNHYGTMNSGHYTAFCKNPKLDRWYKYDDRNITSMAATEVVTSAAYILFYKLCN